MAKASTPMTIPDELEEFPDLIVLDTNCLFEGGWPRPNAKLTEFCAWAVYFQIPLAVPKPVLEEREKHLVKAVTKDFQQAQPLLARVKKLTSGSAEIKLPKLQTLVSAEYEQSEQAVKELTLEVLPHSQRSLEEVFGYAVEEEPPFQTPKAHNFKDVVILLSLVDGAIARGARRVWFVSADGDFRHAQAICGPVELKPMALDKASQQLRGRSLVQHMDEVATRRALAETAVLRDGAQIAKQAEKEVELPLNVVGYEFDDCVDSLTFDRVASLSLDPLFKDVNPGERVSFAATIQLTAHSRSKGWVLKGKWNTTVRVGQSVGEVIQRLDAAAETPTEPTPVRKPVMVLATGTLQRTVDGYDDVRVDNLKAAPPGSILSALLPQPDETA